MTEILLSERALKQACDEAGGAPIALARALVGGYLSAISAECARAIVELRVDVGSGEFVQAEVAA